MAPVGIHRGGDAGCALGAALYADRIYFKNPDHEIPDHPFWGPSVDGSALAKLALGADRGRQDKGQHDAQGKIEKLAKVDRMKHCHCGFS